MCGQECHASILVIEDTACPLTRSRRRHTPALLGMNILQQLLPTGQKTSPPPLRIPPHPQPPLIEAAVRATTLHCRTVVGLARVAGTTRVPARSITTVRVSSGLGKSCGDDTRASPLHNHSSSQWCPTTRLGC